MPEPTPIGLIKILGHVTLIVVLPMLGGALAGILIDRATGASPLFVVVGLTLGTLGTVLGLWLYIRLHRPGSTRAG
jgi:F0F1-type ATP synthase assembly protein I